MATRDFTEFDDTGIVLARGVFREYDVWLRVLFRERGILHLSAFGGLHSRRRFVGCLDVFNILLCRVRDRGGWGNFLDLREAQLVEGPGLMRTDARRRGLGMNCLKLLDAMDVPEECAADCFRLGRETLHLLNDPSCDIGLLPLFFRLKYMTCMGYVPDFTRCGLCRAPVEGDAFFSVMDGAPLCGECHARYRGSPSGFMLRHATLELLQWARDTWPADWRNMPGTALSGGERGLAHQCVDEVLRFHAGLVWEQGRFRHS